MLHGGLWSFGLKMHVTDAGNNSDSSGSSHSGQLSSATEALQARLETEAAMCEELLQVACCCRAACLTLGLCRPRLGDPNAVRSHRFSRRQCFSTFVFWSIASVPKHDDDDLAMYGGEVCRAGLQEEDGAKWPLLTLTRVRESLAALRQQPTTAQAAPMGARGSAPAVAEAAQRGPPARAPPGGASDPQGRVREPQAAEPGDELPEGRPLGRGSAASISATAASTEEGAYRRLSQLDPLRAGYYADSASGAAHVILRTPTAS